MRPGILLKAIIVMGMLSASTARAQLTLYDDNGPSDNRIDFLLLSEGYTAAEAALFQADAAEVAEAIFGESPFKEYRALFNIGFGFVPSNQSGADTTPTSNSVDTALQCYFNCNGTARLICCDGDLVWGTAAGIYPAYDQVLVIVNSATYGGSGGSFSTTSMADGATDIPAHEFGHSLGNLADEYSDAYTFTCDEAYANITKNTTRATLKWNVWVEPQTLLPTTDYTSDLVPVGAFQGGCYSSTEYYRPVWNCMMRSLGADFCPVCAEQLIRSFYSRVEPVDTWQPVESSVSGTSADTLTFSLDTLPLGDDTIAVSWTLDGLPLDNTADTLSLPLICLSQGVHTLTANADDETLLVRTDPSSLLHQEIIWTIDRTDAAPNDSDCLFTSDTDTSSAPDTDSATDTGTGADSDTVTDAEADTSDSDDSDSADSDTGDTDTDAALEATPTDEGCGCRTSGGSPTEATSLLAIFTLFF